MECVCVRERERGRGREREREMLMSVGGWNWLRKGVTHNCFENIYISPFAFTSMHIH